jgi:PST family polysaccharide transporter
VLRGGFYLTLRPGLGIIVSAVGLVLLTRTIGPEAYGLFAAALGIHSYLASLSSWGVNIFLIRHEGEPQPQDYHQAFSLLLLLGLVGVGAALLLLPAMEHWARLEGFGPVAVTLFAVVPMTLLSMVPGARLERTLDYRSISAIELSGQIFAYVVALPLA